MAGLKRHFSTARIACLSKPGLRARVTRMLDTEPLASMITETTTVPSIPASLASRRVLHLFFTDWYRRRHVAADFVDLAFGLHCGQGQGNH
jgi:hypothetical protein